VIMRRKKRAVVPDGVVPDAEGAAAEAAEEAAADEVAAEEAPADGAPTGEPEETDGAAADEPDATEPADAEPDATEPDADDTADAPAPRNPRRGRVLALVVLPVLALLLGAAAGYAKYEIVRADATDAAGVEAMAAAQNIVANLLTYQPITAEDQLRSALSSTTGAFHDSYAQQINDNIIPTAKKLNVYATTIVHAASVVSASPDRVVTLLFANQTVAVGQDAPTVTLSRFQATLERHDDRWLISEFSQV
jgi:Mce-associated membrane protein